MNFNNMLNNPKRSKNEERKELSINGSKVINYSGGKLFQIMFTYHKPKKFQVVKKNVKIKQKKIVTF